jgi:hypothetical protein
LRFSNKNPLKKQQKLRAKKSKTFAKIFRLKKKQESLNKKKQKIIAISLNSLNKLNTLEKLKPKKYKEKKQAKHNTQQATSSGGTSDSINNPSFDPLVDLFNPFDNPEFVVSLANYNLLDLFWSDQNFSNTP